MASRGIQGRGASANPRNRFDRLEVIPESPAAPERPDTEFLEDHSRSIVAVNESPDVGFSASINPYRGCEHGCSYCYARPTHEYLGFSAGLDFETKILVKSRAAELLTEELASPKWEPQALGISGVTDPYQPIERKLGLTRKCLEVLVEFRNPAVIVTKNSLVTRDLDLLCELAEHRAVAVFLSITTLNRDLARRMEPRTSIPEKRLEAISTLCKAGIPAGVLVAPVIPALTDHEIPAILEAACTAGAQSAAWVLLRLPGAVSPLFQQWLEEHFPERKDHVLARLRDLRGGRLYDPRFGRRGRGQGAYADQLQSLFRTSARRLGIEERRLALSTRAFRRAAGNPAREQLGLFE